MVMAADRVKRLSGYAFAEIDKLAGALKAKGVSVIDFGVGDPTEPTPAAIRNYTKRCIDKRKDAGYPSYIGTLEYREAIAKWTKERHGVDLDPESEICSCIGAKEGVFHIPLGFINPGDVVICPNPGYPPYERGTLFAGGEVYFYNLLAENDFLPNLEAIPADICKRARLMWINYPNNPTGKVASKEALQKIVNFGKEHDIIIGSDECYSEIYFSGKPASILELTKEKVFVVQSLSKRSYMTGYRVGWLAGDAAIVDIFKQVKTNVDSGTPTFIQDAATAALLEDGHVKAARNLYKQKRDILVKALQAAGLEDCSPEGTMFVWQKVSDGVSFAKKLLDPAVGLVATPGEAISATAHGVNPGKEYVRFALVPTVKGCKDAAERLRVLKN